MPNKPKGPTYTGDNILNYIGAKNDDGLDPSDAPGYVDEDEEKEKYEKHFEETLTEVSFITGKTDASSLARLRVVLEELVQAEHYSHYFGSPNARGGAESPKCTITGKDQKVTVSWNGHYFYVNDPEPLANS